MFERQKMSPELASKIADSVELLSSYKPSLTLEDILIYLQALLSSDCTDDISKIEAVKAYYEIASAAGVLERRKR